MASAAPPKRMVSSVFITLAPPYRATVTQQPPTRCTNGATTDTPRGQRQQSAPAGRGDLHAQRDVRSHESHNKQATITNMPSIPARPLGFSPTSTAPPPGARFPPTAPALRREGGTGGNDLPVAPPPPPLSLGSSAPLLPSPIVHQQSSAPLHPESSKRPSDSEEKVTMATVQPQESAPSGGEKHEGPPPRTQSKQEEEEPPGSSDLCGFCRKSVTPAQPVLEALNRTYHASCFLCRQCHAPLAGRLYYNKAGIPLCEDCYQASLEPCWACGEVIKDHVIRALERAYHPHCFVCATCSQPIGEQRFAQGEVGEVYCLQDYHRKYAPQCSACHQRIIPREDGTDSYTVECLGLAYHEACYRCEVCNVQLSPEPNEKGCHPLDGRLLCKSCYVTVVQSADH